jgi:hypothetical protein
MSGNVKRMPEPDPAGLDQLLLKLGEAGARWAEDRLANRGIRLTLWDGENGLGRVVQDVLVDAGIPNKRFHDIVSPRSIAEGMGFVKRPKRLKKRA